MKGIVNVVVNVFHLSPCSRLLSRRAAVLYFLQHYMQNSCRTYSMGSGYIFVVPPDFQHSRFLHLMLAGLYTSGFLSERRSRKSQSRDSSLPSLTSHRQPFLCEWKISKKKKRMSLRSVSILSLLFYLHFPGY